MSVSFTTDDGRPATAVQVSSGLSMLPAGWSGPASFACAEASTGPGCTLALAYAPTAPARGSVVLGYAYVNDAGLARTGTVTIPYRATTDDSVVGSVSPTPVSVPAGTSLPVIVSFTTDDGYPASALSVTTDLGSLPAGWSSGAPGFTCASVDGGTGCRLGLSFAPAAPGSGTLSMAYSYTNDAGLARSGTVLVPWTATP